MNLDEIIRLELQLDDLFHEVKKVKRKKEQLQIIEERLVNVKNEAREARCEEKSLEDLAIMQGLFERMLQNAKRTRYLPKVVERELVVIKEIKNEQIRISLPPLH